MGSPYQTSLSEAGQDKFFYLVGRTDSNKAMNDRTAALTAGAITDNALHAEETQQDRDTVWKEIERWTVSIGSKIIKVRGNCITQAWQYFLYTGTFLRFVSYLYLYAINRRHHLRTRAC